MKITKRSLVGTGKLHVRKSRDGQWYFVATARNGEPVATSETYTRKADAVRGAQRFRDVFALAAIEVDA